MERQEHRLAATPWRRNSHIAGGALEELVPLPPDVATLWRAVCRGRQLSGRGAARIRRVARTIADLDDRATISTDDVEHASTMRQDLQ